MQNSTPEASRNGAGVAYDREFIHVVFQSGIPREVGVNGCRVEDVIAIAVERLEQYQRGPLACVENEQAIQNLREASKALGERLRRRQEQGVLNTMSSHKTVRTEDEIEDFSATGS